MKELPKIYKNRVSTDHNKKAFYSEKEGVKENKIIPKVKIEKQDNLSIMETIDQLFKNSTMSYTKEVELTLKEKKIVTRFVKKYDHFVLTIDNDKINYEDILKIEEK